MKNLITIAALAALSALPQGAAALDYPTKDVTIVVPYSPSGSADPLARFIGGELQKMWGQNVIVENKPGAGATIGTAYVATKPADGYTLLLTTAAFATSPSVYKDLPYDPMNDLVAVLQAAYGQFVVTVGPSVKATDVKGLIEEGKQRDLFLATAGLGSSTHFAGELFVQAAGINAVPVHYKGGSDAQVDLMGGRADIYVGSTAATIGNIQGGKTRALAVLGGERADSMPDVPATKEIGLEKASSTFWWGVFAPAGTPEEIVDKINADMTEVLKSDAGKEWLRNHDAAFKPNGAKEFGTQVSGEIDQWKDLAKSRGIEAK